jgi:uncharacterized protein (UPF0548 family)
VELNYAEVGATRIAQRSWTSRPAGFRSYERSVQVGSGDAAWEAATAAVMAWGVKTRSGFDVHSHAGTDITAVEAREYTLVAHFGPFSIKEPVRVVAVVTSPDRCGFAYGTGVGHPVSGEEAFIVSRDGEGRVWLTLRSLTRRSEGGWGVLFPLLLLAQRWYRFRYLRALRAKA